MLYRQRFGLTSDVLPQNACGRTFSETPSSRQLNRRFRQLIENPGLGLLTGDAGVGKTTVMRHHTSQLPRPDYKVIYLCDTATSPLDFYRQLALELGVHPSHRRAQLWNDIKAAVTQLVDDQNVRPVIVCDEAQHLSDRFLLDLSGFLNFTFDSRNLLIFWLVGQPSLLQRLSMKMHAALYSRVAVRVRLEPLVERKDFGAFLDSALKAAGASSTLLSEPASELLFRASRGIPRQVARLLREAFYLAHEREQAFVDEAIIEAVLDQEEL